MNKIENRLITSYPNASVICIVKYFLKTILCLIFQEADLNRDGIIDWNEFLEMMLPGHAHASPT